MQSDSLIHGVDVGKDELFVQCLGQPCIVRLGNNAGEIQTCFANCPRAASCMESTGKYHQRWRVLPMPQACGCMC